MADIEKARGLLKQMRFHKFDCACCADNKLLTERILTALDEKPDYKKPQCHLFADTKEELIKLMEVHLEMLKEGKPDIVIAFGQKPECKNPKCENGVINDWVTPKTCNTFSCPDCQQPPESELKKEAKDYLMGLAKKITEGTDDKWSYKGLVVFLWQACSRLDAQQQKIGERDKIIAAQYEDITTLQNDLFEVHQQKDRREEAIKWLWDRVGHATATNTARKELKRILGDQYKEIVKDG